MGIYSLYYAIRYDFIEMIINEWTAIYIQEITESNYSYVTV